MRYALLALGALILSGCEPVPPQTSNGVSSKRLPERFIGIWAHQQEWCANSENIGVSERAPIRITATRLEGLENSCDVLSVATSSIGRAVVDFSCAGEGVLYTQRKHMSLAASGILYIANEGNSETEFSRCE
jgi:hypothetical protein